MDDFAERVGWQRQLAHAAHHLHTRVWDKPARGGGGGCNHQHEGGDAVRVRRNEFQVSVFERDDALQRKQVLSAGA